VEPDDDKAAELRALAVFGAGGRSIRTSPAPAPTGLTWSRSVGVLSAEVRLRCRARIQGVLCVP
jgi:hypothetical protein